MHYEQNLPIKMPGSIVQFVAHLTADPEVKKFESRPGQI